VEPVKPRRYDASRRRDQAARTRAEILLAARRQFLGQGYASTTIASIAEEAGASADTVYKSFGGKAALLQAVCQDALTGTGAVPAETRSDAMQANEADPAVLLRGLGTLTGEVAPRIAPLLLLLAAAAEVDPALHQMRTELDDARRTRMAQVAATLASKTSLRDGRSVEEVADIMWVYSSPELYQLLVLSRRWPIDRYIHFVGDSLVDALLHNSTRDDLQSPAKAQPTA
jgi:AcrR family transcriptional regulator